MNTAVTSREEILLACRELVSENGLSALNMRAVAQRCGVALGSLYNYFPSKSDLTLAAIESVWQDIFHMESCGAPVRSFPDSVQWICERVRAGMATYPQFFTAHSIGFASEEKGRAREMMGRYFEHMKGSMRLALQQDPAVRADAFGGVLTREAFLDFVLSSLMTVLMRPTADCAVLLELIRRAIY
ncbi:MAG: TetR/AcrR family transcriptional regulator [Eubacteriales bacterium]|nr:TetR/AcrR family transcriptional regulator [Eubacteriales bacterium]